MFVNFSHQKTFRNCDFDHFNDYDHYLDGKEGIRKLCKFQRKI